MKRKEFIKNGVVLTAGIHFLPQVVNALNSDSLSENTKLEENFHIRHGYYGTEYCVNHISGSVPIRLRIDRFDHPDGDMVLYEIVLKDSSVRIALDEHKIMVQNDLEILEISRDSISNIIWKDNKNLLLIKHNQKIIPSSAHRMILSLTNKKGYASTVLAAEKFRNKSPDNYYYLLIK